ncbi:LacI family DNA-binding transcriptional regulator [Georgenia sp. SYP-B2076]|uniref:LacI family DNA-binding transcriptional regulator n=1 Tax=Georgenia sp. SYP-B2076 TaxID=2495881 RepID=UPI0013DE91B0|nr:LacI family DNA-binding transcriptional regulator [Georgenia sp. SYP-B2076]
MSVTIRDVAAAAGVSVATVSRVTGPGSTYPVGAATRARVMAAVEQLGYRPNGLARGLTQKNSRLIGVVVPDIANAYYPEVARGIEDVAGEHGYQAVFCSTDRDPDKARAYVEALLDKRVSGLAVIGGGEEVAFAEADLAGYGASAVFVGRPSSAFPTVRVDNVGAAREMTEHLLGLGHTRVGLIAGSETSSTASERRRGYHEALEASGHGPGLVELGDFTEAGGYAAARRLLQAPETPTAIFASNDRMALGALAALSDLGLRVPQDVALVGFDDVPMSTYVRPALTTVSVSARELGVRAMLLLLQRLNGQPGPREVRVRTRLIVRESCGASRQTRTAKDPDAPST